MSFTFDGSNKRIICSSGTTVIDVVDLYSRWKDWVQAGNAQYPEAFKTTGGDPIDATAGTAIPAYAFLANGWRIRPQEANHTLNVVGGVLLVDGGGEPFVSTLGVFQVGIRYSQPVQAVTVSTGGGGGSTPEQIADAVLDAAIASHQTAGSVGKTISDAARLAQLAASLSAANG